MMRVALYTRVSTDEQGNNNSIPGQLHELREHSNSEGHEVIAEIVDKGEKRHNLDRPGLDEIRELAQSGRVDEVWAWAWDRYGQSPWSEVLALEMAEYDVTLRSLDDGGPGEDAELFRGLRGLLSKVDQEKRIKRSRMGKRSRAREGKIVPTALPYGYQYNTDRTNYVPDPVTMPVVRRMFEMIATGSSLHAIKTTLDGEGVRTPSGKGLWHKITIRRYLLSDLYKPHTIEELRTLGVTEDVLRTLDQNKRYGVWWFGVNRVKSIKKGQPRANASKEPRRYTKQDDAIPVPITDAGIPREWVDAARRYFETYRGWKLTRNGEPVQGRRYYELRGFVYCGVCGKRYTGYQNSSRAYFYYTCQARRNHGTKACPHSHNYNADELEKLVMRDVESLLQDPERVKKNLDEAIAHETATLQNPGSESATWVKAIEECAAKRSRYLDLFADGVMDRDELDIKLQGLEATRLAAETKLQESRAGESRLEELRATKTAILSAFATGILYDGIRWYSPQVRHDIYDALGLKVTVGTDGTLTVDYHVDANVIRLTRAVEEYEREEMESPGRIYSSRTETDTSIVVMKCRAETWRPSRGAARTKVATTPALIAEGGAPAIRMYDQIRPIVAPARMVAGMAKSRRAK